MKFQELKQSIYDLENRMLQPEIRNSKVKMGELLSEDFFEFCSSGNVYFFREDDFKDNIQESNGFSCEIKEFDIKVLTPDVILATYKVIKHHETSGNMKYSLRSSIWKYVDGQWKIIFHQGTLTKEF